LISGILAGQLARQASQEGVESGIAVGRFVGKGLTLTHKTARFRVDNSKTTDRQLAGPAWRRDEIMATTARDVMTTGAECIGENETVVQAAKKMAELGVGALPICGEDDRLKGMLTDRDIAVKVLAEDKDPSSTRAGDLGEGKPVTIDAADPVEDVLRTMKDNKVRRLPVIEEQRLVGIVSQGDLATQVSGEQVGELVEAISAAP
jgi:CBS domain-containing protein